MLLRKVVLLAAACLKLGACQQLTGSYDALYTCDRWYFTSEGARITEENNQNIEADVYIKEEGSDFAMKLIYRDTYPNHEFLYTGKHHLDSFRNTVLSFNACGTAYGGRTPAPLKSSDGETGYLYQGSGDAAGSYGLGPENFNGDLWGDSLYKFPGHWNAFISHGKCSWYLNKRDS
ncbi:unnamed protein product, partial [Chrysoparadoxa australica]